MKRCMKKSLCAMAALCCAALLCACAAPVALGEVAKVEAAPLPVASSAFVQTQDAKLPAWQLAGERPLSAWAAYWDTGDVLAELSPIASRLGTLCYFEAYFAHDGALTVPDTLTALYGAVEAAYPSHRWESYLTFVNDWQLADGSFDLKSMTPLKAVLADTAAMDAHIAALVEFTASRGFDGLEIDYEALRKAPELWDAFAVFCARLYGAAQEAGLGLRVVLEPIAPFESVAFPAGPTYVVMCYNLHGGHSKPGPKADFDFLSSLMEKSAFLPGDPVFALATGGYDWDAAGDATQVTLQKALALYEERGKGTPIRDGASGAVAFRYTDENGKVHTVWFADSRTLTMWAEALARAGYARVSYWRLGGNFYA